MRDDLAALVAKIKALDGVGPNRSATLDQVNTAEQRLRQAIPPEFKQFLGLMNGCEGETPLDRGWIAFWPVQRWCTARELGAQSSHHDAVVFADHCQESWWYAFELAADGLGATIWRIDGPDCVVAKTLADFIDAVLHDAPAIYQGTEAT